MVVRLDQHCPGAGDKKPESLRKWRSEISTEIRSIKLKIPPHRLGSRLSAVRAPSRETASSDLSSVASLGGKTITGAAPLQRLLLVSDLRPGLLLPGSTSFYLLVFDNNFYLPHYQHSAVKGRGRGTQSRGVKWEAGGSTGYWLSVYRDPG